MHRILVSFLSLCFLPVTASALEPLDTHVTEDITVMADPSLTVPLALLARRYTAQYAVPVSASFGSSKNHLEEVREGQEGNVFITAKALWMKQLQQEGLMDVYSRTTIARNRLAFVAPRARAEDAHSFKALVQSLEQQGEDGLFALGDPEYVAEGTYTLETLTAQHASGAFEPHFSLLKSSYMLKNMVTGYDAYGAVFYTDAVLDPSMSLIEIADESLHQPIAYLGAVLVGDNMDAGRNFLTFLKSGDGSEIFKEYGFLTAY